MTTFKVVTAKPKLNITIHDLDVIFKDKSIILEVTSVNGKYQHHQEVKSNVLSGLSKEERDELMEYLIRF